MLWLRAHPYIASVAGALLAIGIGTMIVVNRSDVEPQSSGLRAWGGVGTNLFDPTGVRVERQPLPKYDNLYTEVKNGPPFYYAPTVNPLPLLQTQGEEDFDFDAFITLLSAPTESKAGSGLEENGLDAYGFIPQGLISTSSSKKRMTPAQEKLFEYGNEAGAYIQSQEDRNRAAPQILKDQFEDRGDSEKNAALLSLAGSLEDLGFQLEGIEAPAEVRTTHQKVVASYKELGERLALVPAATNEQEALDAILTYNIAVESFVKNYVALATFFSAHGVTFSNDDPGNVFTFSQVGF